MNLHIIVGAALATLVLSTGLALAQSPAAATGQYGQAAFTNGAYVGDGSSPSYLSHGGGGPNG